MYKHVYLAIVVTAEVPASSIRNCAAVAVAETGGSQLAEHAGCEAQS